jgi:alpha-aminoadipate carrier protein LysW
MVETGDATAAGALQIRAGLAILAIVPLRGDFKRSERGMATCPECDAEIEVDEFDVDKGDQLSCPECGSNLEVIALSPLELDIAPDDDDDEDDDEEKSDDDDIDDEDEDEDTDEEDEGWEE